MVAEPPSAALEWTEHGPRSRRFGDVFFSAEDGLAESRAVFLQGCGLPDAWSGRSRFTVAELGFGTGLNIAALLDLWRRCRPPGGRLHIYSVEGFPLSAADAARALDRWPELGPDRDRLIARWPGRAPGVHRLEFPEIGAILDLAVSEVEPALSGWSGRADAWFLDGFSPALNPGMWTEAVLGLVAARSAPGARAATFTVAGAVRRGLASAGFEVSKAVGFGRKRERLEARLPGGATDPSTPRLAIIGAGIAGAAAARAVRALGAEPTVIDAGDVSASRNPAALVTPRLDAGLGEASRLFARAFDRAVQLYGEAPEAILARGVRQLATQPRDGARFAALAASNVFEPGDLELTNHPDGAALSQTTALVIEPERVLAAWTGDTLRRRVARLEAQDGAWRLLDAQGAEIMVADRVILAAAMGACALWSDLPLGPVRGQASWAVGDFGAVRPTAWGGYVVPTRDGVLFGATHDRGDSDVEVRPEDHARNLTTLAGRRPELAAKLAQVELEGRAAVRATTPDRLPLAGALEATGLHVLSGFGSRGFSLAPQLAEHVAALALGAPSPLLDPAAGLVSPNRFAVRAARRVPDGGVSG